MPTQQFRTAFVVLHLSLSAAPFRMFDAVDVRQERVADSCGFVEFTSLFADVAGAASVPMKARTAKERRSSGGLQPQFVAAPLSTVNSSRRRVRLSSVVPADPQRSTTLRV